MHHECRFVLPDDRVVWVSVSTSRVPRTPERAAHLFYLDLDGFKAVKDRFGHAAGDAVLAQLAERIVVLLRAGDVAARLGGGEFAVLCDDTEPQHAASIAERLRMRRAARPRPRRAP